MAYAYMEDRHSTVSRQGLRLNATAASLLGFLHEGPMSGYELVTTAQRRIGDFWSLTQSQVYRELSSMCNAGLVTAGERGRRDRRPYTLTDAGRAAFVEWVNREPAPESIRFPLLLTLLFGSHVEPARLAGFLARHRAMHSERLAGYETQRASLPPDAAAADPFALATLDFGIAYERAVLAWFDGLGSGRSWLRR